MRLHCVHRTHDFLDFCLQSQAHDVTKNSTPSLLDAGGIRSVLVLCFFNGGFLVVGADGASPAFRLPICGGGAATKHI